MSKTIHPEWAQDWFAKVIKQSKFKVRTIPLKSSKEWVLENGMINHKSGLFFKIVGISWSDKNSGKYIRPLIEQREVGTLGFLLRRGKNGTQILAQAKIEPGNVGFCQIGPTFQATASNAAKVHGGKVPAYKKYFELGAKHEVFQTLQSEQGTRFLGKLNRNTLVLAKKPVRPTTLHQWVDTEKLLNAVDHNNFINTDSRSVLVCSPWEILIGRRPFSNNKSAFAEELEASYKNFSQEKLDTVLQNIEAKRSKTPEPVMKDLRHMEGWKLTPNGIQSNTRKPYSIKQIAVTAYGREVSHWDQPIVDSTHNGTVDLCCLKIDGVLQFYFVPRAEAGLVYKVELGPSIVSEPGHYLKKPKGQGKVMASVSQSDEGGRFFQDVSKYRILQLNNQKGLEPGGFWLTLGEVCALLKKENVFTNESRSVLSLLLKWL